MAQIKARRTEAPSNTWLFYREVAGTQVDEDGSEVPSVVEEQVSVISFKRPEDGGPITAAEALAARIDILPELEPGYVSPAALQAFAATAIQQMLDNKAAERGYDNIQTAVSYRGDPNPKFAAEGQAMFEWRSAVWTEATAMLAVANPQNPPSIEDVLDAMPQFDWPA